MNQSIKKVDDVNNFLGTIVSIFSVKSWRIRFESSELFPNQPNLHNSTLNWLIETTRFFKSILSVNQTSSSVTKTYSSESFTVLNHKSVGIVNPFNLSWSKVWFSIDFDLRLYWAEVLISISGNLFLIFNKYVIFWLSI